MVKKVGAIVLAIVLLGLAAVAFYNLPSTRENRVAKKLEAQAIDYVQDQEDFGKDLELVPPGPYDEAIPNGENPVSWEEYKTNFQKNGGNESQPMHGCFTYTNMNRQPVTIYLIWDGSEWRFVRKNIDPTP